MLADLTPARARKAYVALALSVIIGGLTAWQATSGDGMTAADWVTIALAILTPIGVWAARNTEPAP